MIEIPKIKGGIGYYGRNRIINEKIFEDIKHFDEYGREYWLAREL